MKCLRGVWAMSEGLNLNHSSKLSQTRVKTRRQEPENSWNNPSAQINRGNTEKKPKYKHNLRKSSAKHYRIYGNPKNRRNTKSSFLFW